MISTKILSSGIGLKLFARKTCKIAVEINSQVLEKIKNEEFKPRQHPGRSIMGNSSLNKTIIKSLIRIAGDRSIKTLIKDGEALSRKIKGRHPPSEKENIKMNLKKITEEVDTQLSNIEQDTQFEKFRKKKIQKLLRQKSFSWKPSNYNEYEALLYAIGRSPHELAVLRKIFQEIQYRDPNFGPKSFFDFGSGVGTGMWAASELWQNSIHEYFNIDSSREMNDLSEKILKDGNDNVPLKLRNVFYRQFLPASLIPFDLVLSSFSLFELPSLEARKNLISNLWERCSRYLVIVEEGTKCGHQIVNEAREFIMNTFNSHPGHIFSPCPHELSCPRISQNDGTPCNFQVTYAPFSEVGSALHSTAFYSYVVFKKGDKNTVNNSNIWPRIVRPPLVRNKHTICRLCTVEGKLQEIIFTTSKHGKTAYRCARASKWGDRLPINIGRSPELEKKILN